VNRLGRQGDDLGEVRVNEGGSQHLVVVRHFAVVVLAAQAVLTVDLVGTEVFDPVQGQQVTALQEEVVLQNLAALQLAEHVTKHRPEVVGVQVVEDGPQLGIAGDGVEAEHRAEVVIQGAVRGKRAGRGP
jgi:hypothetical protein